MKIINGILFYTESDLKRIPEEGKLEDIFPKKKYYAVRKMEDSFYTMKYTVTDHYGSQDVYKKFQNDEFSKSRHERRQRDHFMNRGKTYKLDKVHKDLKKRRLKEKNRRKANQVK